jgi:hypothetical protein
LGVGQGFAADSEEPEGGAGVFERVEGGGGIDGGEDEGGAEEDDGARLELEEAEHLRGEDAGPVAAELDVAAVFDRVVADHADREMRAEAETPDDGEGGDERAAEGQPGPASA